MATRAPSFALLPLGNLCKEHMRCLCTIPVNCIRTYNYVRIKFYLRKLKSFVCAQSLHSLCDPMDYSLPGSFVRGILQAKILEWEAMPSSRGFPNPDIEPTSPALQADSLPSEPPGKPKEPKGTKNTIFPKRVTRFLASLSPFLGPI